MPHRPLVTAIGVISGTSMDGIDVAVVDTDGDAVVEAGPGRTYPYPETVRRRLLDLVADPDELDYFTLKDRIGELERAGRPTDAARAGLMHKLSGPLSTLLMPLLAAVAAFGLARSGQVLLRATVGMALGFAYFVADNFSLAMGNVGAYPPLLAAWAPFVLFLLIGETVLIRSEE